MVQDFINECAVIIFRSQRNRKSTPKDFKIWGKILKTEVNCRGLLRAAVLYVLSYHFIRVFQTLFGKIRMTAKNSF